MSATRTIHREEAQPSGVEAVEVVEGEGQELTGDLGGCVGRYRAGHHIGLAEHVLETTAVH